ncbi:PQQ-like beta-propeller repeat protein [Microlunatus parietis]|uniref:Outer membrane protein assembly factor BamB n=1 Tax=Microlunatus parietis TaxID=682979 RepID=A0A7Y9I2J6_9ACTN|nr:PQQ-like beta-propeller repeat protein [Microlunatus parietis]NYE68749.1 outer membrane protein assembly factor BamB [Microlunatus parietis]
MDRRTLLRTAAVTAPVLGGGLLGGALPASAETAQATVDLGPASMACNTLSGGFVGDRPYIVSHLLQPARVGLFDAGVTRLAALADLPTGGGAWASVTDGDLIYIGTHTVADLYRWDTASGELTRLHSLPGATYIWDISKTSDGKLFLGTYPDGKVWEYDPATGALRDLGVAKTGQTYVRSIVADDTTVYAGVGNRAGLIAIDRATGERRDLTPAEFAGESFVYQLTQTETHVIAGTHGNGKLAIIAKNDPADCRVVHPEGVITIGKLAARTADEVFFAAGTGLWRLTVASGELAQLTQQLVGGFAASLHVRGDTVAMFGNTATLWTYDLATKQLAEFDFRAAGMPPAPELPQSICGRGGDWVYVGGHGGIEVHDLAEPGATRRLKLSGEAKSIQAHGRHLYLAMYPSATLVRLDPATREFRTLAAIGNGQNRPNDLTVEPRRGLILIGSSPDYGKIGGALSIFDLRSGRLDVHRNIVDGHPIVGTAAHGGLGLAFAGSERPTAAGSATVAIFDLASRKVVGTVVPVPGAVAIPHLLVVGDVLYGTTNAGVIFALDVRTQKVLRRATLGTGRVDLVAARDRLYAVSHQRLLRVARTTLEAEVVVDGLATDPTSFPMLGFDEDNSSLYTITGRNLLQVRL